VKKGNSSASNKGDDSARNKDNNSTNKNGNVSKDTMAMEGKTMKMPVQQQQQVKITKMAMPTTMATPTK